MITKNIAGFINAIDVLSLDGFGDALNAPIYGVEECR